MGKVTSEQVQHFLSEQHHKRERAKEVEATLAGNIPAVPERSLTVSAVHEICIDGRRLERMAVVLEQLMAMRIPGDPGKIARRAAVSPQVLPS